MPVIWTDIMFRNLYQDDSTDRTKNEEPLNEVGSQSPTERLMGFEPGTFRFLPQRLNQLG